MKLDEVKAPEQKGIPFKSKAVILDKNFNSEFHFAKLEQFGETFHLTASVRDVKIFIGEGYSTRSEKKMWYAIVTTKDGLIYAMSKGSDSQGAAEMIVKQTKNVNAAESNDNPFYNGPMKKQWRDNTKNELAIKKGKLN